MAGKRELIGHRGFLLVKMGIRGINQLMFLFNPMGFNMAELWTINGPKIIIWLWNEDFEELSKIY